MYKLLDTISSPESLKKLSKGELNSLCAEIRDVLLNTVTVTGGHLASNLGSVELTIALHRVFNSPKDKIVWDVGHQSYTHKLLTGRRQHFPSLRQYGGISGFPDPDESSHDSFSAGHASTSISASVGMAIARDLAGDNYDIVAVIGDGGLTGGMAFEALNHAGHIGTNLLVVLDDNGMSISPTVGALSRKLNNIRLSHRFLKAKTETRKFLKGAFFGKQLDWAMQRLTQGAKAVVMPTMIWEELGFTYIGPIDGHNIHAIETALEQAKTCASKPTFIHVITTKGKGLKQAEEAPVLFHSVSPKGSGSKKVISYSEVFSQTLLKIARENPRVVVITAAMLDGNCLEPMAQEFPSRFFDVGICEEHAVTMAAGMASQGFIPVLAIYSTFLQRGFDQIIHDVCVQNLPVVFALDRGGIVGEDGKTHQGIFDLSYLTLMPNMIVSAPKDENELQHLLFTAVQANRPISIRYPRGSGTGALLEKEFKTLPIGKGEVLRTGSDIALLAIGSTVHPALVAAQQLAEKNIDAAVVNARFAKPIDSELVCNLASEVGRILTIEENTVCGGFGSNVLESLEAITNVKVKRLGIPDEFVEHGHPKLLRAKYKLDSDGIAQQAISCFPELIKITA
ncbi:1-deoxy-D-xylulose-5-phosphate synthase [Chloroflexota bacterium]